jgi:hydroxyacylglutathione hydrolase
MKIETIAVGPVGTNCYVVTNDAAEAIIIDPGDEAGRIASFIESSGLSVAAYLLTHGHTDHVAGLAPLHRAFPAPIAIHGLDLEWTFTDMNQLPPWCPVPEEPAEIERVFSDGDEFTDAGLRYAVIHTPGHTPGSVCFHFADNNILFTGDTLFAGSVGRTDLPGGNSRTLTGSLSKIAAFRDSTVLYPGHGPATGLATEKSTNFFLQRL